MPATKSLLIDIAFLLALIAIAAGGYFYSPLLLPKSDVTASPDPGCDLQRQACAAMLPGGGRVELSITPRPIPTLQTLVVEVRVSGVAAKQVAVDFAGIGMDMGYYRPQLAALEPGRYAANATLPVCVTGPMPWQSTVLLETDRQHVAIPFRFDSKPY
ncbi:MAG: hypothetical protein HZC24_05920 [Rhodocyclales bacterium]|nr:hypothetical protein [Rhodocyclales bacterium]